MTSQPPAGRRLPGRRPLAVSGHYRTNGDDPRPGGRPGEVAHARSEATRLAGLRVLGVVCSWVDTAGINRVKTVPRRPARLGRRVGRRDVPGLRHVPRRRLDRRHRRARQPGRRPAALPRPRPAHRARGAARLGVGAGRPDHPGGRGAPGLLPDAAAPRGRGGRRAGARGAGRAIEIEFALGRADAPHGEFVPACAGPAYGMTRLVELSDFCCDAAGGPRGPGGRRRPGASRVRGRSVRGLRRGDSTRSRAADRGAGPRDDPGRRAAARPAGLVRALGVAGGVGNGGHVHLSRWRDGRNLHADGVGPYGLTAGRRGLRGGHPARSCPRSLAVATPEPGELPAPGAVALGRRVRLLGARDPRGRAAGGHRHGRAPGPGGEPRGEVPSTWPPTPTCCSPRWSPPGSRPRRRGDAARGGHRRSGTASTPTSSSAAASAGSRPPSARRPTPSRRRPLLRQALGTGAPRRRGRRPPGRGGAYRGSRPGGRRRRLPLGVLSRW